MKNLILILSAALSLAACSKHDDGPVNPGGNVVSVALPQECGGPQTSYGDDWADYKDIGISAYNWERGHFRRGGCPRGTFAACGSGVGMICVPGDIYRDRQVAWFVYHDGARSLNFCGYQGAGATGDCSYRSIEGAGQIGRACLVGRIGECGPGICAPIGHYRKNRVRRREGRPEIGICVQ